MTAAKKRGRPPNPRGITVLTGATAEHYATADDCSLDDKGNLWLVDPSGRFVALFFIGTALRAQAGPPPTEQLG